MPGKRKMEWINEILKLKAEPYQNYNPLFSLSSVSPESMQQLSLKTKFLKGGDQNKPNLFNMTVTVFITPTVFLILLMENPHWIQFMSI